MSSDIVSFSTSEDELECLIHALKEVHTKLSPEDRVKMTINFDNGTIKTYVEPRGNYEIEVKF